MQREVAFGQVKEKPNLLHTLFGAIVTGYLVLLLVLYRVDTATTISVAIFDFLFVSLLFPLKGSLFAKLTLAVTGNFAGFVWNQLQFQLAEAITSLQNSEVSCLLSMVFLACNCVWIVSFWSLGLSILARKNSREK